MPVGRELKRARIDIGASLDEVAARTRIDVDRLNAIEREDLERLPSLLTVRGAVHAYANEIGLDPDDVSTRYVAQFDGRTALNEFASEGPSAKTVSSGVTSNQRPARPSLKTTEAEVTPWRRARVAEEPARATPVVQGRGILQLVDDRWGPPASGAPFYPRGRTRASGRGGTVVRAIVVGILAVIVGFTVAATLDRLRTTIAPSPVARSTDVESASGTDGARVASSTGDLNGGWTFTGRFGSSDQAKIATVGYRVRVKQEGVRVSGRGYRAIVNGHIIPLRQRTPITLEGRLDGRRLELLVTELRADGTKGSTWVMRISDNGSLRGTFWNDDGAQSRGSASAIRLVTGHPANASARRDSRDPAGRPR